MLYHMRVSDKWHGREETVEGYNRTFKIVKLKDKLSSLRQLISNQSLALFPDFQQKLSVLKVLGYVNEDGTVTLKGRVACELNTCECIIATEMIFQNILEPLNPPEAAGLLSALVFQEVNEEGDRPLTTRMEAAKSLMMASCEAFMKLQAEEGVALDPDDKPLLNFGLSGPVYNWARDTPFRDITLMTSTQEGTIVRCIMRLEELMKEIRNASRVIGNQSLYHQMESASICIKRDIVFAASLYWT